MENNIGVQLNLSYNTCTYTCIWEEISVATTTFQVNSVLHSPNEWDIVKIFLPFRTLSQLTSISCLLTSNRARERHGQWAKWKWWWMVQRKRLNYRIIPWGGVKVSGTSDVNCTYVVSTRETRPCPDHARTKPIHKGTVHSCYYSHLLGCCPVEFVCSQKWATSQDLLPLSGDHDEAITSGRWLSSELLNWSRQPFLVNKDSRIHTYTQAAADIKVSSTSSRQHSGALCWRQPLVGVIIQWIIRQAIW